VSGAASAQYARGCPTCGAGPYQPCRTLTTGRVTDTHMKRLMGYHRTAAAPLSVERDAEDAPTVCIAHGRFIPCRKAGEHRYTANPSWVKSVRDYQESPIEDLTWELAWEATR
jgi:hypothetical protein